MIYKKEKQEGKVKLNLSGPQGNAFFLLGYAQKLAAQLEYTPEQLESVMTDMKSGDYENLIQRFDKEFGMFVDLYRT